MAVTASGSKEMCYWCGGMFGPSEMTNEHCPPKGVFPKHLRQYMQVVRACRGCNESWHLDSDFLRDTLVWGILKDGFYPALTEVRAASLRAREKRAKNGLEVATYDWVEENSQKYHADKVPANVVRLGHIVMRIYSHIRAPMTDLVDPGPEYCTVWCYLLPSKPFHAEARQFLAEPKYWMAHGLFRWRFVVNPRDPQETEWMFSFYEDAIFAIHVYNNRNQRPRSLILAAQQKPPIMTPFDLLKRPPVRD